MTDQAHLLDAESFVILASFPIRPYLRSRDRVNRREARAGAVGAFARMAAVVAASKESASDWLLALLSFTPPQRSPRTSVAQWLSSPRSQLMLVALVSSPRSSCSQCAPFVPPLPSLARATSLVEAGQ